MTQTKSQYDVLTEQMSEDNILEGEFQGAQSAASVEEVLRERIARRAYHIYQQRQNDGAPGDEIGDWMRAEDEVRREVSAESGSPEQSESAGR